MPIVISNSSDDSDDRIQTGPEVTWTFTEIQHYVISVFVHFFHLSHKLPQIKKVTSFA